MEDNFSDLMLNSNHTWFDSTYIFLHSHAEVMHETSKRWSDHKHKQFYGVVCES